MKALVLTGESVFEYKDVPESSVGDDDVLVRIKACGICGSDVHGMDGSSGRRQPPIIMGHEAAGVIQAVGSNVTAWTVGDRVTFDSTVFCGSCWFCRRGQINLCDNRRVLGVSCGDYRRDGAFAELLSVPQHILYRLPDELDFEKAAMVEGLSIALHGVNRVPLRMNDTAVVVGAGMIGLLVIQSLRASNCGRVIAVDVQEDRLQLADHFGAECLLVRESTDITTEILKRTEGRGADAAFEVVGMTASMKTATGSLRKGGRLCMLGNLSPEVEMPLQALVTREIICFGSCASAGEYPDCLAMLARGEIDVDPLISKVAPLAEGATWFNKLYQKTPGLMKVILKP